jgi:hypothetical protein
MGDTDHQQQQAQAHSCTPPPPVLACCLCCGRMALGTDNSVHELLLSLIERLGHEQEVGWLDACSQEMVGVVDQLVGSLTVRH